ncbi:unnamed protein product [marine sediment metagenome]|uniref:Uncharacterized protein n=1 Tax=marine sediment metagenome TaxID=412755 RepID=X0RL97_9ZZZZ
MKYNRTSERIGGTGLIMITMSIIFLIVENMAHALANIEPSYMFSIILMGAGAILTWIGLFGGGFEKHDVKGGAAE